jgi:hypothetical protein
VDQGNGAVTPFEALLRRGGAWLPSDAEGAVRLDGVSQPFGPPGGGGTVDEWFVWADPVTPDWSDDNTNVGTRFATAIPGSWIGNRVWRPATFSAGNSVFGWNEDGDALIGADTPLPDAGPLGAYVIQEFAAPAAIVPGVNYIAGYHTSRYGFTRVTEGATVPFTSTGPHLYTDPEVMSAVAKFKFGSVAGLVNPWSSSPNFHYHVSPVVRFPA